MQTSSENLIKLLFKNYVQVLQAIEENQFLCCYCFVSWPLGIILLLFHLLVVLIFDLLIYCALSD